jgi:hypothetical protein
VPRAAALKVVGVNGPRVAGSERDVTQDFLFINGKAFGAATPDAFLRTLKLLAATTDKAPGLKKVSSSVVRGLEKILEGVGGQSPTLLTLGGYPEINILGDEFYSQGPILYGDYIAKLALKPFSDNLRALTQQPLNLSSHPDGIRQAVIEFFQANSAVWDIQVVHQSRDHADRGRFSDVAGNGKPLSICRATAHAGAGRLARRQNRTSGRTDVLLPLARARIASPARRNHASPTSRLRGWRPVPY